MGGRFDTTPKYPGDPMLIPAGNVDVWNQSAQAVQEQFARTSGTSPAHMFPRSPSVIRIKNTAGSTIQPFDVVRLGDPVFDLPDDDDRTAALHSASNLAMNAVVVGSGIPVISQSIIKDGRLGSAVIDGTSLCRVKRAEDEGEGRASAVSGERHLVTDDDGDIEIIHIAPGNDDEIVWASVRLGAPKSEADGPGGPAPSSSVAAVLTDATPIDPTEDPPTRWLYEWVQVFPVLIENGLSWVAGGVSGTGCGRCVNLREMVVPNQYENLGTSGIVRQPCPITSVGSIINRAFVVRLNNVSYASITDPQQGPEPHDPDHPCVNESAPWLQTDVQWYFDAANPITCGAT